MKSVKKDGLSVAQSSREGRLSLFGQRLHSLTETFYSEILDDSQKKMVIKTAQDFEGLQEIRSNDFTFDECSTSEMKSKDDLSFTFRSIDQSQRETHTKNQIQKQTIRAQHASTPYSTREKKLLKKNPADETVAVDVDNNRRQAVLLGYYPVVTYQPVVFPPAIYLSEQSIPCQFSRSNPMRTMNNQ